MARSLPAGLIVGMAALAITAPASAFPVSARFAWGMGDANRVWGPGGANSLEAASNSSRFTTMAGYTGQQYYNADFASAGQCAGLVPGGAMNVTVRKYGCRFETYDESAGGNVPSFVGTPVVDAGPAITASGTLDWTGTQLTGTLHIMAGTDEPTGGTTTTIGGVRIGTSAGDGASAYNVRSQDESPFGNVWYGISTLATLQVDLTGNFGWGTAWTITGGTVRFVDPGFACQQGGPPTSSSNRGALCTPTSVVGIAGGFAADGSHLSWGWDVDGAGTGTVMSAIEVRDASGAAIVDSLQGVVAGSVLTASAPYNPLDDYAAYTLNGLVGEIRSARGSPGGGCTTHLRWDGNQLSCGTLMTGSFAACFLAATAEPLPPGVPQCNPLTLAAPVPVPASAWLLASALGALASARRLRRLR